MPKLCDVALAALFHCVLAVVSRNLEFCEYCDACHSVNLPHCWQCGTTDDIRYCEVRGSGCMLKVGSCRVCTWSRKLVVLPRGASSRLIVQCLVCLESSTGGGEVYWGESDEEGIANKTVAPKPAQFE